MSGPTDLPEIDHLLELLSVVVASHQFTNRLGEAVLLVPVDVFTEISRVVGSAPDVPPKENR